MGADADLEGMRRTQTRGLQMMRLVLWRLLLTLHHADDSWNDSAWRMSKVSDNAIMLMVVRMVLHSGRNLPVNLPIFSVLSSVACRARSYTAPSDLHVATWRNTSGISFVSPLCAAG